MELFFLGTFGLQIGNHFGCRAKCYVNVLSNMVPHPRVSRTNMVIARRNLIPFHKSDAVLSVDVETDGSLGAPH